MLWFDNLDHSWSGGAGASGDYIADDSINFADYLGQFFLLTITNVLIVMLVLLLVIIVLLKITVL